jgi:MoaA/NifB/PqqE/SkfB family radical SAM enzyme
MMQTMKAIARPVLKKSDALRYFYIYANNKLKLRHKLDTPTSLVFFVTNRCNEKCEHCFYWEDLNSNVVELSLDEIERVAKSMKHPHNLVLTGGEPFARQDIVEVCKIFDRNNANAIRINTNGLTSNYIEKKCREILEQCNAPLCIQVSLDGHREVHNKIRQVSAAYDGAMKTVELLKKLQKEYPHKLDLFFATCIASQNFDEIEKTIKDIQHLKIKHIFTVVRAHTFGLWDLPQSVSNSKVAPKDSKSQELLPVDRLDEVYNLIDSMNKKSKFKFLKKAHQLHLKYSIDMSKTNKKIHDCYAGKINGVMYPTGEVACCEFTKSIGNVKDYNLDFSKIWNSQEALKIKNQIKSCYCIHGCNMATNMGLAFRTVPDMLKLSN